MSYLWKKRCSNRKCGYFFSKREIPSFKRKKERLTYKTTRITITEYYETHLIRRCPECAKRQSNLFNYYIIIGGFVIPIIIAIIVGILNHNGWLGFFIGTITAAILLWIGKYITEEPTVDLDQEKKCNEYIRIVTIEMPVYDEFISFITN